MEKMIPQAVSLGILNSCMEEMAQAVRFHGQEVSLLQQIKSIPSIFLIIKSSVKIKVFPRRRRYFS